MRGGTPLRYLMIHDLNVEKPSSLAPMLADEAELIPPRISLGLNGLDEGTGPRRLQTKEPPPSKQP